MKLGFKLDQIGSFTARGKDDFNSVDAVTAVAISG
jgi:hypothetical protein